VPDVLRRKHWLPRNRLRPDELAALAPGDVVTVESGQEFARRRSTTTVVRLDEVHVTVRRDGQRHGGQAPQTELPIKT